MKLHLQDHDYELESFEKDKAGEKEVLKEWFEVGDMFQFDNLGFTNTVGNTKYLSCADCDLGPIGYHIIDKEIGS